MLLTFSQAANLLAVSRRTIARLCDQGRLTCIRVTPDTPRVRFSEILRLFDQNIDQICK